MREESDIDLTLIQEPAPESKAASAPLFSLHHERYDLQEVLGQGAMGEVLAAQDKNLRRLVAYKQLLNSSLSQTEVTAGFIKEAQITAQLGHPNIIPIYDLEVDAQGKVAYAMKLIQGQTLKERLQDARNAYDRGEVPDDDCDLNRLLRIFLKVCEAMHYAHTHGVIHRDLKPANIMIGPYQEVYVMDWGIARLIRDGDPERPKEWVQLVEPDQNTPVFDRTETGKIIGTPRYLSPQQAAARNADLDGRSDQFTLGLILYEMLCLRPAFQADNQLALLKKILKNEKQPLQAYANAYKIPGELAAIMEKATARKPDARYQDTLAFADDIRRYLRGEAVLARPDNFMQGIMRWMGSHRQATLLGACALFLLCFFSVGLSLYQRERAMVAAQQHERQLQSLIHDLASHAQGLDQRIKEIERSLMGLNAVVVDALTQPVLLKPPRAYLSQDYRLNPPQPEDLTKIAHYNSPVSLLELVFQPVTPSVSQDIKQLAPLRDLFRELFYRSIDPSGLLPSAQTQLKAIASGASPLSWLNVSLEKGLIVTYPGTAYSADFDPRIRPWYKEARQQKGLSWGTPYADIQGEGLMMPCMLPIYGYQNQWLGVSSTDLRLDQVAQNWLPLADERIERLFLLNASGGIIAELVKGKVVEHPLVFQNDKLSLTSYTQSQVLEKMKRQFTGYVETTDTLYAFSRVSSWNWTLVSESPKALVFK